MPAPRSDAAGPGPESPELATAMRRLAARAVDDVEARFGVRLDYSERSVDDLEGLLARSAREVPRGVRRVFATRPPAGDVAHAVRILGAYLGEVMCRNLGGVWVSGPPRDGREVPLVRMPGGVEVAPPLKVHQRLVAGGEHDVRFYYAVVKERVTGTGS